MKKIIFLVMVAFVALGCGPLLPDGVPTCEEAFTNFYAQGCEHFDVEGLSDSLQQMIEGCEDHIALLVESGNEACLMFTIDTLFCLNRLKRSDSCDSCDDEIGMIAGCMPEDDQ